MTATVLDHFLAHADERPNDVFLTQPRAGRAPVDYTFAVVRDEARRMAAHLRSLQLPPGSRVAIATKNCAHFFIADLAIWMAGHVSVALYPTLLRDTVRFILEHSEAQVLFVGKLDTWPEIREGVPASVRCIALPLAPETGHARWEDIIARTPPLEGELTRAPDDPSLIIYTSGSTGRPKGVLHSFRTISEPTASLASVISVTRRDRLLSYLPLAHAMDRWLSECLSLWVGCRVYFADSLDTFVADLRRARPTLFASVPRLWLKFQHGVFAKMPPEKLARLLRVPILSRFVKWQILRGLGLSSVRLAASGSAPIAPSLLAWFRDLGLEVLEGYGMSENFNYSHLTQRGRGRAEYIGHPWPDVSCRLSAEGEVLVKSPGNMLGYYKEPALTQEVLGRDGWLKTGDLGVIDEDGRLKITGRLKELFKTSKGKYVAPVPIENLLNADPHVDQSIVAGSAMPSTHAVLQVTADAPREETERALDRLLVEVNARLPDFERLAFLVVAKDRWSTETGELTPTLKIKRGVLEDRYRGAWDRWYATGRRVIWE